MADIVDLGFTLTGDALSGGSADITIRIRFSPREQAEDYRYGIILVLYEKKTLGELFIRPSGIDAAAFLMLPIGPIASAADITFNGTSTSEKVKPQNLLLDPSGAATVTKTVAIPAGQFPSGAELSVAARLAPELAEATSVSAGQVFS